MRIGVTIKQKLIRVREGLGVAVGSTHQRVKIEAQLASAESVEFGVHALWELACRPESHAVVADAMMMQLADVVEESAAAAATLAESIVPYVEEPLP